MSGRNPNLRRRDLNRRERRSRTKRAVDTSTTAATGSPSDAPELLAQLPLGAGQYAPTGLREIGARAIDVKNQHRHRRTIGVSLFSTAHLGRSLQGRRDLFGILQGEDPWLQVKSVASPRNFS